MKAELEFNTAKVRAEGVFKGPCNKLRSCYMDGPLGLLLYHGVTPVLIISYTEDLTTVYITQIQCLTTKGNRWMWKLKGDRKDKILDFTLRQFTKPVWMLDGESVLINIQLMDRNGTRHPSSRYPLNPEQCNRIQALYDSRVDRTLDPRLVFGLKFYPVTA